MSGGLTGFSTEDDYRREPEEMNGKYIRYTTATTNANHPMNLSPQTAAILEGLDNPNEDESDEDDDGRSTSFGGEKRSGRRKIKIEYIGDKSRRHITFSKRKAGIMKKAYELSTLTGTQVLLLVASETGHVYTFATPKLQPLITKPEGKNLIQACLNAPDLSDYDVQSMNSHHVQAQSGYYPQAGGVPGVQQHPIQQQQSHQGGYPEDYQQVYTHPIPYPHQQQYARPIPQSQQQQVQQVQVHSQPQTAAAYHPGYGKPQGWPNPHAQMTTATATTTTKSPPQQSASSTSTSGVTSSSNTSPVMMSNSGASGNKHLQQNTMTSGTISNKGHPYQNYPNPPYDD